MTSEPESPPSVAAEAPLSGNERAATPPAASPAPPSPAPPSPAPGQPRGFFEWFWRGQSLRLARAFRKELPFVEQNRLKRALSALELADRTIDPVEPLRAGSSLPLAISLYREAAYFALGAQSESFNGPDLAAMFASVPQDLLEFAAGGAEGLRAVKLALVERTFVQTADLPQEALPRDAKLAHDFVHALVHKKLLPETRVGSLLLQRGVRSLSLVALTLAVVLGSISLVQRLTLKPDLAAGKPWRASSSLDTCKPTEHYCAAAHTDIFFCTVEEANPWVEIDLGKPTTFSRLEIINRSDCCADRAVPLAVEVSVDQVTWREVARRKDTFSVWSPKFSQQNARYVRLRALRRTILHLEKVAVRAG